MEEGGEGRGWRREEGGRVEGREGGKDGGGRERGREGGMEGGRGRDLVKVMK